METTSKSAAAPYAVAPGEAAQAIVKAAGVSAEGSKLLEPNDKPQNYLDRLLTAGKGEDVVRFLAYVLPKREAIWWVWVCARKSAGAAPNSETKTVLDAVERWIVQPTDTHRRTAFAMAEMTDIGTPAGCAAVALFFAGGSIAPPDVAEVLPPSGMTEKAVVNGIALAVAADPDHMPERWADFARMGMEVADRIKLWGGA